MLPLAEQRSAGNLRPLLDRAVIAADPAAAEKRERKAKRERDLTMYSLPDGMAAVRAFAPAAAAVSIFTVADLLAGRTGAEDDRPVGARRVDVWADIAEELLTHGRVDLTGLLDDVDDTDETARLTLLRGPGASADGQRNGHQPRDGGRRHRRSPSRRHPRPGNREHARGARWPAGRPSHHDTAITNGMSIRRRTQPAPTNQ